MPIKQTVTVTLTLTIAGLSPLTVLVENLPAGEVGLPYGPVQIVTGGDGAYVWSQAEIAPGLSLRSDGSVAGVPTQAGSFSAAVTVSDSGGA